MNFLEKAINSLNQLDFMTAYTVFIASFLLCIAVVLTKRWHGSFSIDSTEGIQKFHSLPTPRIGGIPIILSLVFAWAKSSYEVQAILFPILFAGMPAFLFGIAEDITKEVGILQRLLATMSSGLFAWWITDYSLSRIDIWGLNILMQFTFFSVLFTSFAVGGVANSINIIDGFNGYAGLTCTFAFLGLGVIALQEQDISLAVVCLILAASVLGFLFVNWPFGKLFLGDGGAYFLGFSLAWIAVLLIERNSKVSTFSALCICILPITEVIFSIYRRRNRNKHPGNPDRLHFHSILQRRYISRLLSKHSNLIKNSTVGILMGLMSLISSLVANFIYTSTVNCVIVCVIFFAGYILIYKKMVNFAFKI